MSDQTVTAVEIIPYLFCADVPASMDWLARVFGLVEQMRHVTPSGTHGEMRLGGRAIMLGAPDDKTALRTPLAVGSATQGVFVYVPDVIAHHAHTTAEGGTRRPAHRPRLRRHLHRPRPGRTPLVFHAATLVMSHRTGVARHPKRSMCTHTSVKPVQQP